MRLLGLSHAKHSGHLSLPLPESGRVHRSSLGSEKLSEDPPLGTSVPHLGPADVWNVLSVLCYVSPQCLLQSRSFNRRLECVLGPHFVAYGMEALCLMVAGAFLPGVPHSMPPTFFWAPLGVPCSSSHPASLGTASPLFLCAHPAAWLFLIQKLNQETESKLDS